jgi:hypothetical protein
MKMKAVFYTCFFSALFLFMQSCGHKKETGSFIYIEIEQMDPELEKCFSEKLYNKWTDTDSTSPHEMKEKYTGKVPTDKHIFKNYDEFDMDKDSSGTVKVMITADEAGGDTNNTFFQLRRFQLEKEGIWSETLNIGHFRVKDRPNDQLNPGIIDQEEICDQMVKFAIKASY